MPSIADHLTATAALLACAACGRIGFADRVGDAGSGGDGAGIDAVLSACPPTLLGPTTDFNWGVGLVATASGYLAAWSDGVDLVAQRVDPDGALVGPATRVAPQASADRSRAFIAPIATGYALAWSDGQIRFTRLDANAVEVGPEVAITSTATVKRAVAGAWTGTHHGLAWIDHTNPSAALVFALVGPTGTVVAGPTTLAMINNGVLGAPVVAWTGSELLVVWSEATSGTELIFLQRVTADGGEIGMPVEVKRLSVAVATAPLLRGVWTGTQLALVGRDVTTTTLYRIDAAGALLGEQPVTANTWGIASIAWAGSRFGLAFVETNDLFVDELDADGAPVAPRLLVGGQVRELGGLAIAAAADVPIAVAWSQRAEPTDQVMLGRICR